MKRIVKNPWTWILLPLPLLWIVLQLASVAPDSILLSLRLLIFITLAVLASRYVLRAPVLICEGNTTLEGVWIIGAAMMIASLMATQILGWVTILLGRPEWLSQQYWSSDIVLSLFYGLVLMAWGARRAVPRPTGGRIGFGGFVVGFLSALGLMLSGILPIIGKTVALLFGGLIHAV